jgi:hypothetical protein
MSITRYTSKGDFIISPEGELVFYSAYRMMESEHDRLQAENDEMRRLLMRALYHNQGGSSPIGQPIRRFFGIGQFDELTAEQKEPSRLMLDGHPLDVYGKPCSEWPACGCPRYCSIPF